ncbi:hypothetical protein H5410_061505 [Solanum commersonii]|uniref:Polyprotein protein n=1 Tax=Solanum commersonii TaxID=4109 RepID=A0A9J5W7Y4_SOLCO|nr:hypothetical protein H5410_061505 [Solanum commersonii]
MGHLAYLANVRDTILEVIVPWMIEAAILAALTPFWASVDDLTMRVMVCESRQGKSSEVTATKAEMEHLRKDVDYLKSTNYTSLLEAANYVDSLDTSIIPPDTIGDLHRGGIAADESEAMTDEKQIEVQEGNIYGGMRDLEETNVQLVIQTSLIEMSMAAPS